MFVKRAFSGVGLQTPCELTFINGPPNWLYVRHDPVSVQQFRLSYRNKVSDILERAQTFEHYKMMTRSMHPQCALTFKEWVTGTRGFLVRLEEVGIFAQGLREWQDRCQLTFELSDISEKLSAVIFPRVRLRSAIRKSSHLIRAGVIIF